MVGVWLPSGFHVRWRQLRVDVSEPILVETLGAWRGVNANPADDTVLRQIACLLAEPGDIQESAMLFLRNVLSNGSRRVQFVATQCLCARGRNLDRAGVLALEKQQGPGAGDLSISVALLGYYAQFMYRAGNASNARREHVLRVISNWPESVIAGQFETQLDPERDSCAYRHARNLWLSTVQRHPNRLHVLENAASFFTSADRPLSKELLASARALEPDNPEWSRRLAQLYNLDAVTHTSLEASRLSAGMALAELERAAELTLDDRGRFALYPELAKAALHAGEPRRARELADHLLDHACDPKYALERARSIHTANVVLGMIALNAGEVETARFRLIESAKVGDLLPFESLYPDLTLAQELTKSGEHATVLRFLELCSGFWVEEAETLAKWMDSLALGQSPDFRSHLSWTAD
jgi:hypothetical protein